MRTTTVCSAIICIGLCAAASSTSTPASASCSGWQEVFATSINTPAYDHNSCNSGGQTATIYWNTSWGLDPYNLSNYDAYENITSFTQTGGDAWYLDFYEDCNGTWFESGIQGPYSSSTGYWELICSSGSPTQETEAWTLI